MGGLEGLGCRSRKFDSVEKIFWLATHRVCVVLLLLLFDTLGQENEECH